MRLMGVSSLLVAVLLACTAVSAAAEPRRIQFSPPSSEVDFRAYGLGLLPIDAKFTRFGGWLIYDPDNRESCRVELTVDVASLATDDASVHDTVIGPEFLDAARFPSLDYAGYCETQGLAGNLGMHGVTRPFRLSLTWGRNEVVAEGRLARADWGMTSRPILGGRTVRIRVVVSLPEPSRASRN
jgi:polyisoprenoid-binding protein YceI